jgi:hypothetical protein
MRLRAAVKYRLVASRKEEDAPRMTVAPSQARGKNSAAALQARALALCLLILAAFAGCRKSNHSIGIAGPGWSRQTAGQTPIPGLDQASVTCGLWPGGGMVAVIWSDLTGNNGIAPPPGWKGGAGAAFEGHHSDPDGRQMDCRCETPDGHTGTVTINDQKFDLAQGSFFLVSTAHRTTQVLQLKRDTMKLASADLEPLSRTDPEIIKFYTDIARAQ